MLHSKDHSYDKELDTSNMKKKKSKSSMDKQTRSYHNGNV